MNRLLSARHRRDEPAPEAPEADEQESDEQGGEDPPSPTPGFRRRIAGRVLTAGAGVLVLAVLTAPREADQVTPLAFLRLPVEAIVAAALLITLRGRARRVAAVVLGVLLGVLGVLRLLDVGFRSALGRPFDPVLDWGLVPDGTDLLANSIGRTAAIASVVAAGLLVVVVVVLVTLAVRRLASVAGAHRRPVARVTALAAVAWLALAATGSSLTPPVPLAARSAAALAWDDARQVPVSIADERAFAEQAGVDAFGATPPSQLLGGLRGRDVMLTFVESYGRSAVEDPRFAPAVDGVLDTGTRQLAAAGFSARSGWLTSPVSGGGSWLAHATLGSGLWIDNQQRDRSLTSSDRLTLTSAFQRAGWDTVGVMPGTTDAWPESRFYGIDRVQDAHTMGYRGLNFAWSPMPDQFALDHFRRTELARPGRGPLMAEIVLTSSHVPWTPVPSMLPWDGLGDGTVYDGPVRATDPPDVVWQNPDRVRDGYRDSIAYSLTALTSFLTTYGNGNTVMVFLGDHQASPIITGSGAGRDVPVTIVAKDPAVLDRVSSWGWTAGLKPAPAAPVWRMDQFRDRFLTAFAR